MSPASSARGDQSGRGGIRRRKNGHSLKKSDDQHWDDHHHQRSSPPLILLGPTLFVLGIVIGIGTGAFAVIFAHAQISQTSLQLAARKLLLFERPCRLGEICKDDAPRPLLDDGRDSHAVWDLPRYHVRTKFRDVTKKHPEIQVSYLWADPVVVYFDNALSDDDIKLMLDIAERRFSPSTIVQPDGSSRPDTGRTSDTAWLHFYHYDTEVQPIVNRLVSLAGFHGENAESLGVNRYRKGQYFSLHHDYMNEAGVREDMMFPRGCQRAATVLAYLSDVESGGETVFIRDENYDYKSEIDEKNPDHLVVKPKKGRVLVWFDMHPNRERVDERTLHGGQPVMKGEKIAATIFIRNCSKGY